MPYFIWGWFVKSTRSLWLLINEISFCYFSAIVINLYSREKKIPSKGIFVPMFPKNYSKFIFKIFPVRVMWNIFLFAALLILLHTCKSNKACLSSGNHVTINYTQVIKMSRSLRFSSNTGKHFNISDSD